MDARTLTQYPAIYADTLDELCQAKVTRSVVTLAADLVARGRLDELGDPVGFMAVLVEEFGANGLVTYRLRREWSTLPLEIRVTPLGYQIAGYSHIVPAVGSRAAKHAPIRPAEPMEWRSLANATYGGAIERTSLSEHLDRYPEHRSIHPSPWECGPYPGVDMAVSETTKKARQRTRALEVAQAIDELGGAAGYNEIMNHTGWSHVKMQAGLDAADALAFARRNGPPKSPGVRWEIQAAGRVALREADEKVVSEYQQADADPSLRQVIIDEIRNRGTIGSSRDLMRYLGQIDSRWGSVGLHSLQHQLRSMKERGLVDFRVTRHGSVSEIVVIRLGKHATPREESTADLGGTDVKAVERISAVVPISQADLDDAPAVAEQVTNVLDHKYPELDRLRAIRDESDRLRARADAFLTAASALDGVDQAESDRLMASAAQIASSASLTTVEAEYLRYASDKENA